VKAEIEALLAAVGEDTPVSFQPCRVSKEIQFLKLGRLVVLMAFQINVSTIFQKYL
jgi:hypothetical protein